MIGTVPLVVGSVTMLAVLCLSAGLYRLFKPTGELEDRLARAARRGASMPRKPMLDRVTGAMSGLKLDQKLGQQTALDLTRAGIPVTVNEYILIRVGAALAGLLLGLLVTRNVLFALLFTIVGMQLPVFILHRMYRQRQVRFQKQLVDVISMLVSGLRAGVGLVQAMDLVRREMPAPAGEEFGRVVSEIGLGSVPSAALTRLIERMPGDDLQMLVTVVNIQAEVGGNLADILDSTAQTIRERVRILQEIRTLTAEQRATAYLLAGLPFLVGAAIMGIRPGYMQPMFQPQWVWLPVTGVLMMMVGFVFIRRIIDVKV